MPASGFLCRTLIGGALCLLTTLAPAAIARPVTPEDLATSPAATWQTLAQERMHLFTIPEPGLRVQMLVLNTELLRALLPVLSSQPGFPSDPAAQAAIINALKPQARSAIIYMAVRDAEPEPSLWSPVFGVGHGSFRIRLAASANLVPFDTKVVAPVGFHSLAETKPTEPADAWRGLYELEFMSETEYAEFMHTPGLLLEYQGPQKSVFLNIASLRSELELDAEHPEAGRVRPLKEIATFFAHFPPRESEATES